MGYEAVQMSSLPSVVLPLRSSCTPHEEALNAAVMTHMMCDTNGDNWARSTSSLVLGLPTNKRVLCLLTLCLSVICWAISHVLFLQHLTPHILCQRLKKLVFCLHVSLKSRI